MDCPQLGGPPLHALALGKSRSPAEAPLGSRAVERYQCEECGRELFDLQNGPSPTRCEDCVPGTGPGSPLVEQLGTNLRRLRRRAGMEKRELARRAALKVEELSRFEDAAHELSATRALRLAHSMGVSIDELVERIYWNPGETVRRPRRPPAVLGTARGLLSRDACQRARLRSGAAARSGRKPPGSGHDIRAERPRRSRTPPPDAGEAGPRRRSKQGRSVADRARHPRDDDRHLAVPGPRPGSHARILARGRRLECSAPSLRPSGPQGRRPASRCPQPQWRDQAALGRRQDCR